MKAKKRGLGGLERFSSAITGPVINLAIPSHRLNKAVCYEQGVVGEVEKSDRGDGAEDRDRDRERACG